MPTGFEQTISSLSAPQQQALISVKRHAESILNHTPRFKFFTLHGTNHLDNLFDILQLLIGGGVDLNQEELNLLSLAICIHDLGMVASLSNNNSLEILVGRPAATDPTALEEFIRKTHHELIDLYYQNHLDFLTSLGISPQTLGLVRDISRSHRVVLLKNQHGIIKRLGALLRVIDELDLGANRAPYDIFMNLVDDMDTTSTWHWYKHNIVEAWSVGHTVSYIRKNNKRKIEFSLSVRPNSASSIPYWLGQIRRPIHKALDDDGAGSIIADGYGVDIELIPSRDMSAANSLGDRWTSIEQKALSSGRRVVLIIDDEFRRLEDLFIPIMDDFHLEQANNARDAFTKMQARNIDLAIVDMQIGSGSIYKESETDSFKTTGVKICEDIMARFPQTKIAILTGTRHAIPSLKHLNLQFFLTKPVDSDVLLQHIHTALK